MNIFLKLISQEGIKIQICNKRQNVKECFGKSNTQISKGQFHFKLVPDTPKVSAFYHRFPKNEQFLKNRNSFIL